MLNLYDLTGGNYDVRRTVTYPDHPNSTFVFDTEVRAIGGGQWSTNLRVTGTYDGPTDIVSVRDYQVNWTTDGKTLAERGRATLLSASGDAVRSEWTSTITPLAPDLAAFPVAGEVANVSYSPFELAGDTMSYEWEGSVQARPGPAQRSR